MQTLAGAVREVRLRKGLSQEDVANAAGISVYTYACVERGRGATGGVPNPTLDTVLRIMWVLDLTPSPPSDEARTLGASSGRES
ncbi:helix-turn-helix transcriptional regulator [Microbacterium xanthum]|uniref:helix-turn-helix transcriptional regulator n=1 Tax=Microbacterium xanthum TaxID=3079794 RepID=UPI003A101CC3